MPTVADVADDFVKRAQRGEKPKARVKRSHAESFLGELARLGIQVVRDCLDEISDPELRRIVEVIFFSTAAGAVGGAVIGGVVAGPPGAKVGAVVGAGLGFVAGCIAITVRLVQEDRNGEPELVVQVQ